MTFTWDESMMNLFYDIYRYEKKEITIREKKYWNYLIHFGQFCSNLNKFAVIWSNFDKV